ncbi:DGQHR domain-containing protein DpdB [Herbaspirillum rhizosphaerae]|uniref:DGQHR domain-containing protein DpdB n=1 Tax=Herbaspirillum rhizosphaerae TaxID=346179 RepID=UPI0009FA076F|nr:DGQHR domain-containing protein DpdB [Herbaspirillum rhizosphaerae]
MASKKIVFDALIAEQSPHHQVLMIRATASQIHKIAAIQRLGRDTEGKSVGFQRAQVSGHIAEIREYLEKTDAVLPNALVLAFVSGAKVKNIKNGAAQLEVDLTNERPGLVVDGQQRLSALTLTEREDFQVFAACLICPDINELRRQFILINNTKPLSKSLIYELLPSVPGLPDRLTPRSLAAKITESLNFTPESSLYGFIKMETYPTGILKDTVVQKAIMNSESAGAIQVLMYEKHGHEKAAELVSNFFHAVRQVFSGDWEGHKPATSRLVHGVGIVAMGYVMDEVYSRTKSISIASFKAGLTPLIGRTAWTNGHWHFSDEEVVPWNRLENTPRQYQLLAEHLVGIIRRESKSTSKRKSASV